MPLPAAIKARLENRLKVLLIFSPPTFGMILGGVVVNLYGKFKNSLWNLTSFDVITLSMALVSILVISGICYRSVQVWQGSPSRFSLLFKIAPISASLALIFGTVVAGLKAAGIIK